MSELTSDKRYNSILQIIDDHLLPDTEAKKKRGEVFTPPALVREILFGLKKSALDKGEFKIWGMDDKGNFIDDNESGRIGGIPNNIWKNPNSTFLDPANGIGNFPVIAFYKLDYELKKQSNFRDVTKRRKHIIEKMLYMIELDKGNCQTSRAIFKKICPEAKPNICCKDTTLITDKNLLDSFGINRFDIIMGNPPFQKGKNSSFYVDFIKFAISKFKGTDNSYLAFIIPNRILIPKHEANKVILSINPYFMIHTVNNRYFKNIATKICGVLANNIPYKNKTLTIFNNGNLDINLNEPTPSDIDDIRTKLISDKILLKHPNGYLEYSKTDPKKNSIFIKRQWIRYSPLDGNKKTHVFDEILNDSHKTDGKWFLTNKDLSKNYLSWYLTKSQAIRFITLLYASSMNVPPFLWDVLPKIKLSSNSDSSVYAQLNLSKNDINYINKIMKEGEYYSKKTKTQKNKGGSYKNKFNKTRKNK